MSLTPSDIRAQAEAWIAEDPDPATRAELADLLADGGAAAEADLAQRFSGTLEFGTAGLRGPLGAGPMRMNRVVVTRAAAGLAAYLRQTNKSGPVVIGYDARRNSDVFARDTAEVLTGAGFEALVMPRALPTPLLAFAILELGASAGVMVTASHNPPQDNGYKVYLGDGSQIVPPADTGIAACIAAVGALGDVPRGGAGTTLGEDIVDRYLATLAEVATPGGPRELRIVYTPMHGVGGRMAVAALEAAGFPSPVIVEAQFEPDPAFPTVAFPNPEEPGAMDLALAAAAEQGADLVIANDPDADRCAAAVPVGSTNEADGWRMLRGDEVGALLGHDLLSRGVTGTYACSLVSSGLLGSMATSYGQPFVETLTGFKWIGRLPGLVFGYEEALGYCVDPDHVKDKDGLSAMLLLCDLAARLRDEGRTLLDRLEEIYAQYGVHVTDQLSLRVEDLDRIAAVMARLRASPPTELGGVAVVISEDLLEHEPPTDGLRYRLEGARVVVRPSGTEPKLKCYLEAVGDGAAERLAAIRTDIAQLVRV